MSQNKIHPNNPLISLAYTKPFFPFYFFLFTFHNRRQRRPSRANSSSASAGPQDPDGYSGIGPASLEAQRSRKGCTRDQAASTESTLSNRVGSPSIQSRRSLS